MKGVCVNIQKFRCHNSDESVVYTESIPAMLVISLSALRVSPGVDIAKYQRGSSAGSSGGQQGFLQDRITGYRFK